MNTTQSDTTDSKDVRRRRTPRPRTAASGGVSAPASFVKARKQFEARAQDWLLGRPDRIMQMPDDLNAVIALGVPALCGALPHRDREGGHTIVWTAKRQQPGDHWAAGITATCRHQ